MLKPLSSALSLCLLLGAGSATAQPQRGGGPETDADDDRVPFRRNLRRARRRVVSPAAGEECEDGGENRVAHAGDEKHGAARFSNA